MRQISTYLFFLTAAALFLLLQMISPSSRYAEELASLRLQHRIFISDSHNNALANFDGGELL